MKILGIDPGTAITGYGLVEVNKRKGKRKLTYIKHGCIKTSKNDKMARRLFLLYRDCSRLISEFTPGCVAVEQIFFGANSKTAITVGQARGVVILASEESKIPLFEYQGLAIKRFLTGYGRSNKKEIQKKVKEILSLDFVPKPDDAADGLAIAIYHGLKF